MVAWVEPSLVGQCIDVLFIHADLLERWRHATAPDEVVDEMDRLIVGIGVTAGNDVEAAGDADAAIDAWLALGVEAHDGWKADGVCRAMVHAANGRERMRQRVGCAEILLERHAAHGGGDKHLPAGVEVGAVGGALAGALFLLGLAAAPPATNPLSSMFPADPGTVVFRSALKLVTVASQVLRKAAQMLNSLMRAMRPLCVTRPGPKLAEKLLNWELG